MYLKTEVLIWTDDRDPSLLRDHVTLFGELLLKGTLRLARPPFQLRQFVDEEDSRTLGPSARFHDPGALRRLSVLLDEHVVVSGEYKSHRNKIQM